MPDTILTAVMWPVSRVGFALFKDKIGGQSKETALVLACKSHEAE